MTIKHILLTLAGIAALSATKAQELTFKSTPKGLAYHIYTDNSGTKVKVSDVITFNVIQKTDKDSVLFSTYKSGTPVKLQVQPSQNIGDLMDIFPLLGEKDSVLVKVPTDSIFVGHEDQRPPFLGKGSNLLFVIKIVKIQALAAAIAERDSAMAKVKADALKLKDAEAANIQKYIADNKLTPKATLSGLKYIVNVPTLKHKPLKGDTVYVNYVGHTLSGQVFDTSIEAIAKAAGVEQPGRPYEPLSLVLGENRVIAGWEEGLLLMTEGSKATFIIPSALGYGENGSGPIIKPYSTLIFELELVKIRPIKHLPAKPAAKKKGVKKPVKKAVPVKK